MLKKGSSNHLPRPRCCQLILAIMLLSGDRDVVSNKRWLLFDNKNGLLSRSLQLFVPALKRTRSPRTTHPVWFCDAMPASIAANRFKISSSL